jgi:hypothetical protein
VRSELTVLDTHSASSFKATLEVKLFKDTSTLYDTIMIPDLVFPDECMKLYTDSYIGRVVAACSIVRR